MPRSQLVDFKALKAAITMEQVLQHYGLLDQFKRSGDSLSGPCPIHKGSNSTQFRVSVSKNIWNCFSECKHGGNTLDFISRMDNVSIHAAALKAIDWFGLDQEAMAAESEPEDAKPAETKAPAKAKVTPESNMPNKPLKFQLDKLERDHPYLLERGLTPETIMDFGIGFCAKGTMAGRIAIPIHNVKGEVVAYAGRQVTAEDEPKYKLPLGFRKSQELFNLDRAIKEPAGHTLVIVEGFFDCMKLHQNGCKKVVALMGSSLSAAQEELIQEQTASQSRVLVMLDEDEAGQAGREDIATRLSRFCFVGIHEFSEPGFQPENLSLEQVRQIMEDLL